MTRTRLSMTFLHRLNILRAKERRQDDVSVTGGGPKLFLDGISTFQPRPAYPRQLFATARRVQDNFSGNYAPSEERSVARGITFDRDTPLLLFARPARRKLGRGSSPLQIWAN